MCCTRFRWHFTMQCKPCKINEGITRAKMKNNKSYARKKNSIRFLVINISQPSKISLKGHSMASRRLTEKGFVKILFCWQNLHKWLDGVQVQNIRQKPENPCRWSKIPLHKDFKLILDQNVTNRTYSGITRRSQKYPLPKLCTLRVL